jgi:hypothetical protein
MSRKKFRFSEVIVRFIEVIVRFREATAQFREVIVRFREVIVWFSEVIVKKIVSKIVATYVYASSQGQRTHSARTNTGSLYLC